PREGARLEALAGRSQRGGLLAFLHHMQRAADRVSWPGEMVPVGLVAQALEPMQEERLHVLGLEPGLKPLLFQQIVQEPDARAVDVRISRGGREDGPGQLESGWIPELQTVAGLHLE